MGETCILLSGRTSVRRSYENHDAVYKMTKHECRMTKEWNNSCGESCSATFPVATGLWPVFRQSSLSQKVDGSQSRGCRRHHAAFAVSMSSVYLPKRALLLHQAR